MLQEMMNVRQAELASAARKIQLRMEVEELSRIERLERSLRSARSRLAFGSNTPVKA